MTSQHLINLIIAMGLGTLIGLERRLNGHVAGVHTHAMVAFGAATFTVVAIIMSGNIEGTKVVAQVVTGIGFLCSGVIMQNGLKLHGINSAVTIWSSAAIGCLAGIHQIILASSATVIIVIANYVFHFLEHRSSLLIQPLEKRKINEDK